MKFLALWLLVCSSAFAADPILVWDPNTEPDLAGYRAYWGTASRSYGPPVNVGLSTTYIVPGLAPGTYYFAVTAYNSAGYESGYSNEVSATVEGPIRLSITSQSASLRWFGVVLLATTDNPATAILRYHKAETGAKVQTVIASPAPRTQHRAVLYFPPGSSFYSYTWTVTDATGAAVSVNGTFQTR